VITISALFAGILSIFLVPENTLPTELPHGIAQVISDIPSTIY